MSIPEIHKRDNLSAKLALSGVLLIAMGFFFVGDHLYARSAFPIAAKIVLTAIPTAFLLGLTIFLHRNERFQKYWETAFAFFCGSFGLLLAWAPGSWPERYFSVSANTAQGVAILKLSELLPVALAIILLTKYVQGSLAPIYLQKGDLKTGLGLGLLLSLILFGIYMVASWSTIDLDKAMSVLPWMIIFSISDAFFEELLIRGLLLKRFIGLFGIGWSVVLSALCYGLFFLGVQSAAGPIPWGALLVILPLGLLYSFIMAKSNALWGSLSLHATIDLIYLIGIFASN